MCVGGGVLLERHVKGVLNPNFLNLTIKREKFWLYERYGPIS